MKKRLRTSTQKRSEARIEKVFAMINEMSDVEGSNWQKYEVIAKKLKITPNYIAKIVKKQRDETKPNSQPAPNS